MKQITILHVVGPTSGGIKEYVTSLVTNIDKNRFKQLIAGNMPLLPETDIEQFHLNLSLTAIPKAIWSLCKILTNKNVDIIHAHGLKANLVGIIAARLSRKGKVIYTMHGGVSFSKAQPGKAKLYAALERILVRYNTKIITVSDILQKELHKRTQGKHGDIVTIHAGLKEDRLKSNSNNLETIRHNFHIPANAMIIGTIARLAPQKGLCYLIKAMKQILYHEPDTILLIAGDGPLRNSLENLVKKENIHPHVCFLGFVQDIGSLLGLIHVFVLPSWTEGFPITILEALLAEKAVVATKVGGIPEIIQHEVNGLLIEPRNPDALASSILNLLKNSKLRKRLGTTGKHIVKDRFSLEQMIAKYLAVYNEITNSKQWMGDMETQNV